MFRLVGSETFEVGKPRVRCTVKIEPCGAFAYQYSLDVDGKAFRSFTEHQSKVMRTWLVTAREGTYRVVLGEWTTVVRPPWGTGADGGMSAAGTGQLSVGTVYIVVRIDVCHPGLEKSRLKLNLCQPVAFINLSRFKPAFINKSRLKFRINEITENHSSKE